MRRAGGRVSIVPLGVRLQWHGRLQETSAQAPTTCTQYTTRVLQGKVTTGLVCSCLRPTSRACAVPDTDRDSQTFAATELGGCGLLARLRG